MSYEWGRACGGLVRAGADSVEHGNYVSEETLQMMAESDIVWVPTITVVANMFGCGRFRMNCCIGFMRRGRIISEGDLNWEYIWHWAATQALIWFRMDRDCWMNGAVFGNVWRMKVS